jgi:hypothetical protein
MVSIDFLVVLRLCRKKKEVVKLKNTKALNDIKALTKNIEVKMKKNSSKRQFLSIGPISFY